MQTKRKQPEVDRMPSEMDELLLKTDAVIDLHRQKAKQIIDDYWLWWKGQNQQRVNLLNNGGDREFTQGLGSLAPMLRYRKNNQKWYIEWRQYRASGIRKNLNKQFSEHITPESTGYSNRQLSRRATTWEEDRVLKTEAELAPHRDQMNLLHEFKVAFRRNQRRLEQTIAKHSQHEEDYDVAEFSE